MEDPISLELDEIVVLHSDQVDRYGGSHGLRDAGALESAIAPPRSAFDGFHLHVDLFSMAAAYLFHLVQNHPFVDGNKRVGSVATLVFLDLTASRFTSIPTSWPIWC